MQRRLAVLLAALLTVAGALVLSACSQQQADLLDQAFKKDINSAHVSLSFQVQPDGPGQPLALSVDGPLQSGGHGQPASFDLRVHAQGGGLGAFDGTRIVSDGQHAAVEYHGTTYRLTDHQAAHLLGGDRRHAHGSGSGIDSLGQAQQLGLDLRSWFPQSDTQDDANVDGVATTRVTGTLDLAAALRDLRDFARQHPAAAASSSVKAFAKLSDAQIDRLAKAVQHPTFAVDVAKSDGTIRRIEGQARLAGPRGAATLRLVLQLTDVNQPVHVQVPSGGKPVGKLLRRLRRDLGGAALGASTHPAQRS